ncbi:hypothetical protein TNCV_4406781 [Trichonephila clavipes]|nr:hypothetical protein TNCV_4406781 [Trichonephila clavipes]
MTAGALLRLFHTPLLQTLYVSLVIQPVALAFLLKNTLLSTDSTQEGVFQQDNVYPHITVTTQHALQSVDELPKPDRSSNLSPNKYEW